jgi:hypothetical protein
LDNFTIRQGEGLPLTASLTDDQGDPITSYTGSETLTATCWPGGNLAASFSPTVAWLSGPGGTINIAVSAAQTAGLAEGRYFGTVTLVDPSLGPLEAYCWTMDLILAPGTGTAGLAYVGFSDLIKHARVWLRSLQDADSTGGFVLECADASRWLDDFIIARYPTNNYAILGDPGYGSMVWGANPGMLPNQWLIAGLASGWLVLRPKVIECVAKRALSIIAKGQIGVGESKADFRTLGRIMETESSAIAMTLVAELCTDGSGVPNLGIPLGGTSMRPQFGA